MKVIVGERRTGRTTKLIEWLLQGAQQAPYPAWSRVIVVMNKSQVRHTTDMVYHRTRGWVPECDQIAHHVAAECEVKHNSARVDVIKAVWSLSDLAFNLRGRTFEYALDNADDLLKGGSGGININKPPSLIVLGGKSIR